jgi:hypothetical protein
MHNYPFVKMQKQNTTTEPKTNDDSNRSATRTKRSVGKPSAFWDNASTITFSFMEQLPDSVAYRIEVAIRRWEPFVNLAFELVENGKGQIRIALGGADNHSAVGTDALMLDPDEPTLVVSVEPDNPYFEYVLTHEFGHALGFHHAHLHPDAEIPWDKEAVYEYYINQLGWNEEEVDANLFTFDSEKHTLFFPYDKLSIMHYSIPGFLTLNKVEIGINMRISEGDQLFARAIYPPIN